MAKNLKTATRCQALALVLTAAMAISEFLTPRRRRATGEAGGAFGRRRQAAALRRRSTWSRSGCEMLVQRELDELPEVVRRCMPHNFVAWGPWVRDPRLGSQPKTAHGLACLEHAARLAGWLRVVGHHPLGARFLARTQSPRGMASPYTLCDLHKVVGRFPSPHRFVRWVARVARRGDQILAAYKLRVSWEALAGAAQEGDRRSGRAAARAAAWTVAQVLGETPADGEKPWQVFRRFPPALVQRYLALGKGGRQAVRWREGVPDGVLAARDAAWSLQAAVEAAEAAEAAEAWRTRVRQAGWAGARLSQRLGVPERVAAAAALAEPGLARAALCVGGPCVRWDARVVVVAAWAEMARAAAAGATPGATRWAGLPPARAYGAPPVGAEVGHVWLAPGTTAAQLWAAVDCATTAWAACWADEAWQTELREGLLARIQFLDLCKEVEELEPR